jgi:1-acyl-sn-glycerol-3-phosphate acyltransferase
MALLNNFVPIYLTRAVFAVGGRSRVLGREHLPARGTPFLLAITHMSHYDPIVVGVLLRRKIDYMTRGEFYHSPGSRWACEKADCIRLERYGFALPGIREGLGRLGMGRMVGIFPEGELMSGSASVLNGGPIKRGAAVMARAGGVPIVPCVVLGSDQFRNVTPWLPLRRGRLYLGLGPAIESPSGARPGRASRAALSDRLAEALRAVYREMDERWGLPAEVRP